VLRAASRHASRVDRRWFAAGVLPTRTRFAESLVVVYLLLLQQSNRAPLTVRFGYATATATAPALDALFARRCAPSLRRHDLGQVLGNLFALLFSGCAARSSFVQGAARRVGLAGPPSQSAFTRSQCVGPHATYPASCAVRMRPSSLSWRKSSHEQVSASPNPSHLGHTGKTARKPNGYRVSSVLTLGRFELD
jgi:hypothetical protein